LFFGEIAASISSRIECRDLHGACTHGIGCLEKKLSRWVTRREAATILGCSYENVKRLQRIGQLHSYPDKRGVHRFDRREVEALALKRGQHQEIPREKELEAFRLFKLRTPFEDVFLATAIALSKLLELFERFQRGYNYGKPDVHKVDEARIQREHEQQMLEMERELERRRKAVFP
jgi:hypothetical protein